jgi:hypothetical protein
MFRDLVDVGQTIALTPEAQQRSATAQEVIADFVRTAIAERLNTVKGSPVFQRMQGEHDLAAQEAALALPHITPATQPAPENPAGQLATVHALTIQYGVSSPSTSA